MNSCGPKEQLYQFKSNCKLHLKKGVELIEELWVKKMWRMGAEFCWSSVPGTLFIKPVTVKWQINQNQNLEYLDHSSLNYS